MYTTTILLPLLVLPLFSSALVGWHDSRLPLPELLRWYVFWAFGIRLAIAGISHLFSLITRLGRLWVFEIRARRLRRASSASPIWPSAPSPLFLYASPDGFGP